MLEKRYLVLEDGSYYEGYRLGSDDLSIGEIVFNTAMTGYQETISDPSYTGQIKIPMGIETLLVWKMVYMKESLRHQNIQILSISIVFLAGYRTIRPCILVKYDIYLPINWELWY